MTQNCFCFCFFLKKNTFTYFIQVRGILLHLFWVNDIFFFSFTLKIIERNINWNQNLTRLLLNVIDRLLFKF